MTISAFCSGTAMASPRAVQTLEQGEQVESVLLSESVKTSTGEETMDARSQALANAMCMITNTERGIIGIYAETAMFKPVDWACLTVYLEQWNEAKQSWVTVEKFEKEFTPADTKDGELTSAILSIDVGTQPSGYYYRLRCIHELEFDGDWYEGKVTKTDGVLLTNIKK